MRLLALLEESERERSLESEAQQKTIDQLNQELSKLRNHASRLEDENARLTTLADNTRDDIHTILSKTDARLKESAHNLLQANNKIATLENEANATRTSLNEILAECAVPFDEPQGVEWYAKEHEACGVPDLAVIAVGAVVSMRDRLLERENQALQQCAALQSELARKDADYAALLQDLNDKIARAEALIASLQDDAAADAAAHKAELEALKAAHDRALAKALEPIPSRTRSESPRNPKHWMPTNVHSGCLYQDIK